MLHRAIVRTALLAASLCVSAHAQTAPPRVVTVDPMELQALRARAASHADSPALQKVRADAERALRQTPLSVTQKDAVPPSGDKHDYLSLAPYFWPNPNTPNHLPYVRRDGERNPEISALPDHANFDRVMNATYSLGLAYYLFGDERYAAKSAELLRAWFLDPATRMNPNLNYAQGIRGINTGRGIGLIETRGLGKIVDAVGLLAGSKNWTASDQQGLEDWCAKFFAWLQESKNGQDEAKAKNNHGTYFDVQFVALALFLDKRDLARQVLEAAKQKRIAAEVEPDGSQPLELARTKSYSYSAMNLNGLFQLAELGDRAGVDLWNFKTKDGRSIRAALDFMLPYALGEKKWTRQQIEPIKAEELVPLLLLAAQKYSAPAYRESALRISPTAAITWQAALIDARAAASSASAK
jgi:hypothetical protein